LADEVEKGSRVMMMNGANTKLEKAVRLMNQKGLNGLIIYSRGVFNILSPSYLHYFSEVRPMGPRNAAVVSRSGDVVLLVEPPWDSLRTSAKSWIKDVRGTSDFVKDLTGIIRKLKISGPVGVVGSKEMTQEVYSGIKKEADAQVADDIIEEITKEKTEREIEIVRKVARIADAGSDAFVNGARVGVREYELVAELEFAMRSAGADDIFILMGSGKHNDEMHEPTDRRLSKGDVIIGEITPAYEGQFIQLCRTVFLGKPSPVLFEKYDMLIRALDASLKVMKSGAPASLITTTMNQIIGEAGYGKYCKPPYMRSRGHGFAVGSIAPGAEITDTMKVNLVRHQVVAVHPNQYIPETGYLACGESVLVTDTGIERLAKTDTKIYVKEG
jgi:Xaa-Pro dipeptidase